jgi:hypothetical protein
MLRAISSNEICSDNGCRARSKLQLNELLHTIVFQRVVDCPKTLRNSKGLLNVRLQYSIIAILPTVISDAASSDYSARSQTCKNHLLCLLTLLHCSMLCSAIFTSGQLRSFMHRLLLLRPDLEQIKGQQLDFSSHLSFRNVTCC